MESSKKQLIKELREYLDKAEKDETTYFELLMEILDNCLWRCLK